MTDAEPQKLSFLAKLIVAVILALIVAGIVLGQSYPAEAVIVALLFAFIPYVIICGPAARIARQWHRASPHQTS